LLPTDPESALQDWELPPTFDVPLTESALHKTLVQLGFFPTVMMNIRCMLEEEEKLHRERIQTKLPEIVSETYWNLITTLNQASNEVLSDDTAENATNSPPIVSRTPTFYGPVDDVETVDLGRVDPSHHPITQTNAGAFLQVPVLTGFSTSSDAAAAVQYNANNVITNDTPQATELMEDSSPRGGIERTKTSHQTTEACSDFIRHKQFVDLGGNYCYSCNCPVFPSTPGGMTVL
jgi:hypothetical protein